MLNSAVNASANGTIDFKQFTNLLTTQGLQQHKDSNRWLKEINELQLGIIYETLLDLASDKLADILNYIIAYGKLFKSAEKRSKTIMEVIYYVGEHKQLPSFPDHSLFEAILMSCKYDMALVHKSELIFEFAILKGIPNPHQNYSSLIVLSSLNDRFIKARFVDLIYKYIDKIAVFASKPLIECHTSAEVDQCYASKINDIWKKCEFIGEASADDDILYTQLQSHIQQPIVISSPKKDAIASPSLASTNAFNSNSVAIAKPKKPDFKLRKGPIDSNILKEILDEIAEVYEKHHVDLIQSLRLPYQNEDKNKKAIQTNIKTMRHLFDPQSACPITLNNLITTNNESEDVIVSLNPRDNKAKLKDQLSEQLNSAWVFLNFADGHKCEVYKHGIQTAASLEIGKLSPEARKLITKTTHQKFLNIVYWNFFTLHFLIRHLKDIIDRDKNFINRLPKHYLDANVLFIVLCHVANDCDTLAKFIDQGFIPIGDRLIADDYKELVRANIASQLINYDHNNADKQLLLNNSLELSIADEEQRKSLLAVFKSNVDLIRLLRKEWF